MHARAGFGWHLCLLNACAALSRRELLLRPPAAAGLIALQPHAAAAAAKAASPQRSSALDAAGYAYALVRAADGGQVVTLDLDRTNRVRSAVYLYETRAQADAVRKAVMSARDKNAAPLALAKVPLGEAAALVLAPPAKREGVPGYFCHRLLVEQSRLAAARKITGISDLGDRFLPLFYVDDCVEIKQCVGCTWLGQAARNRHRHAIEQASRRWCGGRRDDSARTPRKILIPTQVDDDTGSREASGGVQAFFDPKAAELVRKEATTCSDRRAAACQAYDESGRKRAFTVREADAFVLLRKGGLDELDLVPSTTMAADGSKSDGLVALDDSAPLEVVLELECDVANSNCVISKMKR